MKRRDFVAGIVGCGFARSFAADRTAVRIAVDTTRQLNVIPPNFIGLGYEISSVAVPGQLSAGNKRYLELVRALGSRGMIRIGGNTSDDASYSANGPSVSEPKGAVVTKADLNDLATFLKATGWKLIWGLNLGSNSELQVVEEAAAVSAAVADDLFAFEIGNEPDLFGRGTGHRPHGYSFDDYLAEYRRYKAAIRVKLPRAPFAGPDVAAVTDWVSRFAQSEGGDLKLLTHHYYRQCKGPTSTLDKLLGPDPKLGPQLEKLKVAAASCEVPYRICEVNSFCGGGQPGVSDTFGAALWVLDYLFTLAAAECSGVNIETGVNQLGFVSSYSPIVEDVARPIYYGMLAFAQASRGRLVTTMMNAGGMSVSAYAVRGSEGLCLTIINKEERSDVAVSVSGVSGFERRKIMRLSAPSLASKESVRFGVDAETEGSAGVNEFEVPAGSAALVIWR